MADVKDNKEKQMAEKQSESPKVVETKAAEPKPSKPAAVKADAPQAEAVKPAETAEEKIVPRAGTAADAQKHGGVAPTRKYGSAKNFSSDNMNSRGGNRGDRRGHGNDRRGGRRNDRGHGREEGDKQFEEVTVAIDRVSRTVKGGRRLRFKALVVVGDKKNKVGVGVSKGQDVQQAIQKATDVAKKHLTTISLDQQTIPHEVEVKFGGAHVLLKPAAPGTGIIAGGVVRSVIGVTGVKNLISKSLGSTNKVNIAYATMHALSSLIPKNQWVGAEAKPAKADKATKSSAKSAKTEAKGDK
jgi:small subunit ribosomal protein S5